MPPRDFSKNHLVRHPPQRQEHPKAKKNAPEPGMNAREALSSLVMVCNNDLE
jgi:hypothetical protein